MRKIKKAGIQFSEITLVAPDLAKMICDTSKHSQLYIVIQDEFGRPWFDKKFALNSGENELHLGLPMLPGGTYHIWAEVAGNTFIRQLQIEKVKKCIFGMGIIRSNFESIWRTAVRTIGSKNSRS